MVKTIILNMFQIINNSYNQLLLMRKKVDFSKTLRINGKLKIHGNGKIYIGENVKINSSESSNPIGGSDYSIFSVYSPGVLKIGNNVGISNAAIVCFDEVTIEDNVFIGGGVKIYDSDFHSLDYEKRIMGKPIDEAKSKPVMIRQGAFIGAHSIILKGVTIGERSVIGAGSVVTKSVPNDEIWAGNPAVRIRKCGEKN